MYFPSSTHCPSKQVLSLPVLRPQVRFKLCHFSGLRHQINTFYTLSYVVSEILKKGLYGGVK